MADHDLERVLLEIQRRGAIGRGSIAEAVDHSEQFTTAIPAGVRTVVDLGSGGGLPGLVIARARPELAITLVERRAKRADLLNYGILALGLSDSVSVAAMDVAVLGEERPGSFDVVTARSFGPPLQWFGLAARLLRPGGWIVVSEPPDGRARWSEDQLDDLGLRDEGRFGGVRRMFHVEHRRDR